MKSINHLRIGVVDDYEPMRSLLVEAMRHLGFTSFVIATNGVEALRKLSAYPPDLLLVDYNMQPITGIQLTRLIRVGETGVKPAIPIIMVTAHAESDVVGGARDAGATEYLIKPITVEALHARIKAAIERPRPFVRGGNYVGPDRRRRSAAPPGGLERRKSKPAAAGPIRIPVVRPARVREHSVR